MILKPSIISIFVTILVVFLSPVMAGSQFYGVEMDQSNWLSSGNRIECRLTQNIPGYGKAAFSHRSLKSMEFRVTSNYPARKNAQALLYIQPTIWKRFSHRKVLGRVPLTTLADAIVVPEDWAYRMVLELREGMEAVWTHTDFADGSDIVTVKVSPLHFEPAWRDFLACSGNLIDYGYKDVRYSIYYFKKKSMHLTLKEKARLDKLAEYVLLDTEYQYIKINSHTDSRGVRGKNLAISKKRAYMVKKYLVKQGVNPKQFIIVARGEKKPKYNNRTRVGRAKNRRIEVRLVK